VGDGEGVGESVIVGDGDGEGNCVTVGVGDGVGDEDVVGEGTGDGDRLGLVLELTRVLAFAVPATTTTVVSRAGMRNARASRVSLLRFLAWPDRFAVGRCVRNWFPPVMLR
jgi:hypothetical protein